MGVTVEAQNHEDSDYVKNVQEMCKIGIKRGTSLIKSNDYLYPLTFDYYREKILVRKLHTVTNSIIDSRLKQLEVFDDTEVKIDSNGRKSKLTFLDILIKSTVDGKSLSKEDIREEVDTFMFEGHDTTASAMSFALFLLSNHSEVQERAFEEQKQIFANDIYRSVSYEDLQKMKYLETIIKETIRLYPSVPIFARKTTEDITYKGNTIPAGVNLMIFCYGILRDPENYTNPHLFNPDRFKTIDGKKPYSYIPFSAGPRNCIGQKFAMLEMKTMISKILRNFVLLPVESHRIKLLSEAVLKTKNGLYVQLTKRKL